MYRRATVSQTTPPIYFFQRLGPKLNLNYSKIIIPILVKIPTTPGRWWQVMAGGV